MKLQKQTNQQNNNNDARAKITTFTLSISEYSYEKDIFFLTVPVSSNAYRVMNNLCLLYALLKLLILAEMSRLISK